MQQSQRQNRFTLASRIIDLAREAHFETGYHLREQQLADFLQVSRTPIRAALLLLEEKGIVESQRNKGFFLRVSGNELNQVQVEAPTSADQDLYARIVEDRLAHRLDEVFSQTEILRRYGVDRNVLQKTLTAFQADGLISRGPGRNWTFQPTLDSRGAQAASYGFRRTLEPAGILMSTFRANSAALDRLKQQHLHYLAHPDPGSLPSRLLFELDATFHETIAEFSGNSFLLQAIQQQNRLRRLLEFASYTNRRRVQEWCQEHIKIIAAIQDSDFSLASNLMAAHLDGAWTATASGKGLSPPLQIKPELRT